MHYTISKEQIEQALKAYEVSTTQLGYKAKKNHHAAFASGSHNN